MRSAAKAEAQLAGVMDAELAKVAKALEEAQIPGGAGIAVHHLGGWEKLAADKTLK